MDYGYYGEVVFVMLVMVLLDFQGEILIVNVVVDWQVCEEVCVFEICEFFLIMDVGVEFWNMEDVFWMIQVGFEVELCVID